jgi:four helix bundle protein
MVKSTIQSYRDLLVWKKAIELAVECYRATRAFRAAERYGLSSQIRRAAVSVAANIAEGHGRKNRGDFLRHLAIANGSLMELESHLAVAARLSYLRSAGALLADSAEVGRTLNGLFASLSCPDT